MFFTLISHPILYPPIQYPHPISPTQYSCVCIVNDEANDTNTIVFNLHVKCERNPKASPQAMAPEEKYLHSSGTSCMPTLCTLLTPNGTSHKQGHGMAARRHAGRQSHWTRPRRHSPRQATTWTGTRHATPLPRPWTDTTTLRRSS